MPFVCQEGSSDSSLLFPGIVYFLLQAMESRRIRTRHRNDGRMHDSSWSWPMFDESCGIGYPFMESGSERIGSVVRFRPVPSSCQGSSVG